MFCHKCGKEVPGNVRFCHHCGATLPVRAQHQPHPPHQSTYVAPSRPPHKNKRPVNRAIIAVIVVLFGLGIFWGGYQVFSQNDNKIKAECVVYLEVYDKNNNLVSTASGFFIEDEKTLVTNFHVINGARNITVSNADGSKYTKATTVLAYDKRADLAILRCDSDLGVNPLPLANSNSAKQGDTVFAVGYPLGLANTMSDGIISSRYLDNYDVDVLQITAAISPGSSGGALFNKKGSVIGVTSAYYDGGQNLNIAIASNTVRALYQNRLSTPTTLKELNK